MIKGIILDFNGTMYKDHDLNHDAWQQTFNAIKGDATGMSYDEFQVNIETLTKDYDYVEAILKMFNKEVSEEIINKWIVDKETRYKDMAIAQNRSELMIGLPNFLDYLKINKIPYCIASMAPKMNFDFYLEYLNLKNWFTYKNIVYDCELWKDKNAMYIEACKRLKINIDEALLIEDSPKVIMRSLDIGIKNLIYFNSKNKELQLPEIKQEITNYDDFDYLLLNSLFFNI